MPKARTKKNPLADSKKQTPALPEVNVKGILKAAANLQKIIYQTPLQYSSRLSQKYHCRIYLKREDLQITRSYKIRGAYNLISSLSPRQRKLGVVCASAGNHAQGVALSCKLMKIKGKIFMPQPTPKQKIDRVKALGEKFIELELAGDTFDETNQIAKAEALAGNKNFIPPFDHPLIIMGQGTVGKEIFRQIKEKKDRVDILIVPIGGGGLAAGVGAYAKNVNPKVKIFGAEPLGAPSMHESFKQKKIINLDRIDKFVDGAAVKRAGDLTYPLCLKWIDKIFLIPEGKVCLEMISLYQSEGIVAEPAGALSVAALDEVAGKIRNKAVVCVISGGNNDISRYSEIIERSLIYQGLKHYFIVEFSQRPGALRKYLDEVLGANDDIIFFEYMKRDNRESGPAIIGIELSRKEDLQPLLGRMNKIGFNYETIKQGSPLFRFII